MTARRVTGTRLVRRAPDPRAAVELDVLAREAGLSPALVERLVRLGVVSPLPGGSTVPTYRRESAARLARAVRLRRDLGLNYAGAILALDLLDRIDVLETRLRSYEAGAERRPATPRRRTPGVSVSLGGGPGRPGGSPTGTRSGGVR